MTVLSAAGRHGSPGSWQWPVDAARYDTAPLLRAAEPDAIAELGPGNLRRPLALQAWHSPSWHSKHRRCEVAPLIHGSRCLPPDDRDGPEATAVRLSRCYRIEGDVTFT